MLRWGEWVLLCLGPVALALLYWLRPKPETESFSFDDTAEMLCVSLGLVKKLHANPKFVYEFKCDKERARCFVKQIQVVVRLLGVRNVNVIVRSWHVKVWISPCPIGLGPGQVQFHGFY